MSHYAFVLYSGQSTDGRGEPKYDGWTLDIDKAIAHWKKLQKAGPYGYGNVQVLGPNGFWCIHQNRPISDFDRFREKPQ